METENYGGPGRGFLLGLGALGLLVGLLVAAFLVIPLQSPFVPPASSTSACQAGEACISMPSGVGNNNKLNFDPVNATVVVGVNNTVVWSNDDTVNHTVVSSSVPKGAQTFSSPQIAHGQTFRVTLTVPGVYQYFCSIHPLWMKASIVVKAGSSSASSTSSQSTSPKTSSVVMPQGVGASNTLNFTPKTMVVVIGVNNTVTWTNMDVTKHTVHAQDNSFSSGDILPGQSFTHTFRTPGNYSYYCDYHSWMRGLVIVKA
jgi:plastocyanin